MRRALTVMALGWAVSGGVAVAQEGLTPVGHRPLVAPLFGGGNRSFCPPASPGMPYAPGTPGVMPGMPYAPGTPGVMPGTPGSPGTPGVMPGAPGSPIDPNLPPDPNPQNPIAEAMNSPFAQAAEAGGLASNTFNENFDGDFPGVYYARSVVNGFTEVTRVVGFTQRQIGTTTTTTFNAVGQPVTTITPVYAQDPVTVTERVPRRVVVRVPLAGRYHGVQIVDNDNPRPVDRVYFGYNFYSDVGGSLNGLGIGGSDVQRQTAGFEKTFLDGDASFGMRLPFVQQYGPADIGTQNVGDLSLLFKYAFINNRETGNVASVGLVVTTPTGTGGDVVLIDGETAPHSTLFQPWMGFVRVFDRAYVQGISNLIVPSDNRDPTLWGNSVGVGYWVYRNASDRMIQGIIPVAEVHVRTPLNHRDPEGAVFLMDQVNLTTGAHIRCSRATISGAICVPLVGPIPWQVEAMGYINYRF